MDNRAGRLFWVEIQKIGSENHVTVKYINIHDPTISQTVLNFGEFKKWLIPTNVLLYWCASNTFFLRAIGFHRPGKTWLLGNLVNGKS